MENAFRTQKQLCNKNFAVRRRLQLFNSTVTAVLLYGSGTWTLKSEDLKRLQTEQRKVLRMMLQISRRQVTDECSAEDSDSDCDENEECVEAEETEDEGGLLLEDWVSWVRRATRVAEAELEKANLTDWVREQRKRYWDFAGRVARCFDGRWSHEVLDWVPENGARRWGAPCKRWKDDIAKFLLQALDEPLDWMLLAQDEQTWNDLRDRFVEAVAQ